MTGMFQKIDIRSSTSINHTAGEQHAVKANTNKSLHPVARNCVLVRENTRKSQVQIANDYQ